MRRSANGAALNEIIDKILENSSYHAARIYLPDVRLYSKALHST